LYVTGMLLQSAALHIGPLTVSQAVLVITDPFASIILSICLFGERFTDSPAKITVAVVASRRRWPLPLPSVHWACPPVPFVPTASPPCLGKVVVDRWSLVERTPQAGAAVGQHI
jgi:hypothetical protein